MKKWIGYVVGIIISLIITFGLFELMSWYHLGDIPTRAVTLRLIGCFLILTGMFVSIISYIYKKRNS